MKKTILAIAAAASLLSAAPALAGPIYMTGTSDPWGSRSNAGAMDAVFGAGNWTKINGFDASVFSNANSFIFLDGGDTSGQQFADFLNANRSALTSFVNAGGHVLSNAAPNGGPGTYDLGFGYTLTAYTYSGSAALTAQGIAAGLSANGAGTSFTGNSFSHAVTSGGTGACLVSGSEGCVFAGGVQGQGAYYVGGQTTTNFQSDNGLQLRINQLKLVAGTASAVPEPAAWALMILGFGIIGSALRRRIAKSEAAFTRKVRAIATS